MFGEAGAPDRETYWIAFAQLMREAALNKLESLFKRRVLVRREQEVEVIGHYDMTVDAEETSVAIVEDLIFEQ